MTWTGAKWKAVVLDFLERAGWSAGQVFFATLLAGGSVVATGSLPWKYASILAVSAGVSSIVLTAAQYLTKLTDLPFWPDVVVRLAKTFLASLAASIVASGVFDVTKFHWSAALNVAFLATLTALGKALLARGQAAATHALTGGAAVPAQREAAAERTPPSTLPLGTYLDAVKR